MKQLGKLLENPPVQLALAGVILIGFIYFLTRKTLSDVASATGLSTRGTTFEGAGLAGTLGNIANKFSGGGLENLGVKISSYFFPTADPSQRVDYIYTLPNGERHSISSLKVSKDGFFVYNGVRYRLAWNSEVPRRRIAVAA